MKTQTVRVCDFNNRHWHYEWVLRVVAPARIAATELAARTGLNDLQEWLMGEGVRVSQLG